MGRAIVVTSESLQRLYEQTQDSEDKKEARAARDHERREKQYLKAAKALATVQQQIDQLPPPSPDSAAVPILSKHVDALAAAVSQLLRSAPRE